MQPKLKYLALFIFSILFLFFCFRYINNYLGWTAQETWEYRIGSNDIQESKARGVFVKELMYSQDFISPNLINFKPFIERGFKCSKNSLSKTIILESGLYPYGLGFNSRPRQEVTILIKKNQLGKFDSTDACWGYLKESTLRDTIELEYYDAIQKFSGTIKVWEKTNP